MGRWRGKRNKKARTNGAGAGAEGGEGQRRPNNNNIDANGWVVAKEGTELRNPVFEAFYKAQGVVPKEEWDAFMQILKAPLPASFRINLDCDFADMCVGSFIYSNGGKGGGPRHEGRIGDEEKRGRSLASGSSCTCVYSHLHFPAGCWSRWRRTCTARSRWRTAPRWSPSST